MARFHNYSFGNILEIARQRPDAPGQRTASTSRALVGSEGTRVTILEAVCELKPSPQNRRLVALGFDDTFIAADHVPALPKIVPPQIPPLGIGLQDTLSDAKNNNLLIFSGLS